MTELVLSPLSLQLIDLALQEDLGAGDVSTAAIFSSKDHSRARLLAKEDLVLAGAPVFDRVMRRVAELVGLSAPHLEFHCAEGSAVKTGTTLASMHGPTSVLLRGERVALNFLQHLSGVATATHRLATLLGPGIRLVDTRKTLPGMREMQRYAVRMGGGFNHRFNLGAGVMIKDNHIHAAGSIAAAVAKVRLASPHTLRVEVEVQNLAEVEQALQAGADIIMLDNMDVETMRQALTLIDHRACVEVSGNVNLATAPALRDLAVDVVSCGALTHSVKGADISLRFDGC